jgi:hypothetical protein
MSISIQNGDEQERRFFSAGDSDFFSSKKSEKNGSQFIPSFLISISFLQKEFNLNL